MNESREDERCCEQHHRLLGINIEKFRVPAAATCFGFGLLCVTVAVLLCLNDGSIEWWVRLGVGMLAFVLGVMLAHLGVEFIYPCPLGLMGAN